VGHFLIFVSWYIKLTASDYYQLDDLLSPEEQTVRKNVRECMEKEIAPIMTEVYFYHITLIIIFIFRRWKL